MTDNNVTHQTTKYSATKTEEVTAETKEASTEAKETSTTKHLLTTLNQFQLKRSNLLLKHKNRLKHNSKDTPASDKKITQLKRQLLKSISLFRKRDK